jgi:hypothetical protein
LAGGADTAIHVAGEPSVAAAVARPGGRVTSVTDSFTQAFGSDADYVRTVVAPSGDELADLLFKLAVHRLHSPVGHALSFDQVGNADDPPDNGKTGRSVLSADLGPAPATIVDALVIESARARSATGAPRCQHPARRGQRHRCGRRAR